METSHPDLLPDLRGKRELTDDIKERLEAALREFNDTFTA